ncbi:hypothetical protein [Cupriavidus basilensis]
MNRITIFDVPHDVISTLLMTAILSQSLSWRLPSIFAESMGPGGHGYRTGGRPGRWAQAAEVQ